MSFLCSLVGHEVPEGYAGGTPYFSVATGYTDGVGREHANLKTHCGRCGVHYTVGAIHLPQRRKDRDTIEELQKRLAEFEKLDLTGY